MKRTWSIGRLLGIPLEVDISWLLIFVLFTAGLESGLMNEYFPNVDWSWRWGMAAAISALLFTCVLLHELAHCYVALRNDIPVQGITLFIFGGVAGLSREPDSPASELKMAAAGPAMSLLLAGLASAVAWSLDMFSFFGRGDEIFRYLAKMNFYLAAFNMVPGFPLDGGRICRACLTVVLRDPLKATRVATAIGQAFGTFLILLGGWAAFHGQLGPGLWYAMIGWFLNGAARTSYDQMLMREVFHGVQVGEVMNPAVETVSSDMTLEELVQQHFLRKGGLAFPVVEDRELKGIVTLSGLRRIPKDRWPQAHVTEVTEPLGDEEWIIPQAEAGEVFGRLLRNGERRLLVVESGVVVGAVNRNELLNYMRVKRELGI